MSFEELRRDWTTLGREDPLWAVYVAPGTRGQRWDVTEFFATGQREVERSLAHLTPLGLTPGRRQALDFGAGVGRLSAALADHFEAVLGVDVSPTMLEEARRLDRSEGRIQFVLNDAADLAFVEDESIDLVYSSLVLQHLPADLAGDYLREFLRVLRPDGVAIVQVVSRPVRSVKGLLSRYAPFRLMAWGQTHLLDYPAPMRMTAMSPKTMAKALNGTGARVIDTVRDRSYGGDWESLRYYLVRA